MKSQLKIILPFITLFLCLSAAPCLALNADLRVLDPFIEVGDIFEVEASVTGEEGWGSLFAFGFEVDPDINLSIITYEGFMIGDGYDPGFFDNPIEGFAGTTPPDNAGDNILLATLTFKAWNAGVDTLNIRGLLDDWLGLYFEGEDLLGVDEDLFGDIKIMVNPVPEPATILLLASGMAGLGVFGRKKFKKN